MQARWCLCYCVSVTTYVWDRFCIFFENARALCSKNSAVTAVYPLGGYISLLKVCLFFTCLFETCGVGRFIFSRGMVLGVLIFFFVGAVCFRFLTNQRRMHVLLQVVAKHCTLNAGLSSKWQVKAGRFMYLTFTHLLVAFMEKLVTSPLSPKIFWAHNGIIWYWAL